MNYSIKIINSMNNNCIISGSTYNIYFNNHELVGDLLKLFVYILLLKDYSEERLFMLQRYKLFTKDSVEMDNNKQIRDYFTSDHILDIYERDENIFHAILI
tara:strand:+ start:891 stop:1193 length:303 start_codon:yes stop_codon:yes gene_type:complete